MVGQWTSLAGVAAGVGYLGWRVSGTLRGAPGWLAAAMLTIETVGFVSFVVLLWALWQFPDDAAADLDGPVVVAAADAEVAVVVRCAGRGLAWVRATVLASRSLGDVIVLDLCDDPDVAALADEYAVGYVAADGHDLNGLALAAQVCTSPWMLLLDAGDIPHESIVERLRPLLVRADVAIVQGLGASALDESAQHSSPGRHERDFESRCLVPSLGVRGVAPFTGSGALVRVSALAAVDPGTSSPAMAASVVTAALFCEGWRIVAPGGEPLVATDSTLLERDAEESRACAASAARYLVFGAHGALRINRLVPSQRLALLACSVRPLSGLRRAVLVAVVVGVLLAGRLPFLADPTTLAAWWLPWFVLPSLGLGLLSGGTLRPGDRARQPFRVFGAAWRGVLTPNGRPESPRMIVAGAFGLDHSVAPAAAVAAISVMLALRGLSDRFTHTLEVLSSRQLSGVLLVALWLLWAALDAMRLLARSQSRGTRRVVASLTCTLGERGGFIVDLTPRGAGLLCDADAAVGGALIVDVVIPTARGCTSASIPAIVQYSRLDFSGEHRLGVSFGRLEPHVADALAEYCIVAPARDILIHPLPRAKNEPRLAVVTDYEPRRSARLGLRAAALMAVAGAFASALPAPVEAAAGHRAVRSGPAAASEVMAGGAMSWAVVLSAGLLGVGVLAGSLWPTRRRVVGSADDHPSTSPDLAIR